MSLVNRRMDVNRRGILVLIGLRHPSFSPYRCVILREQAESRAVWGDLGAYADPENGGLPHTDRLFLFSIRLLTAWCRVAVSGKIRLGIASAPLGGVGRDSGERSP